MGTQPLPPWRKRENPLVAAHPKGGGREHDCTLEPGRCIDQERPGDGSSWPSDLHAYKSGSPPSRGQHTNLGKQGQLVDAQGAKE